MSDMTHSEIVESLRWRKFPVLNDGFVCLVDVMGDDRSIVQAARVSYGEGTRKMSDDRTLLRYLLRHQHTTPFEMADLKFLVRVPMDTWRQWIRHRTASVNEYSTRYSIAINSMYATEPDAWRTQSTTNRQGSADYFDADAGQTFSDSERVFQQTARTLYEEMIEAGVAREQARKNLPLSTYTEAYWKIDLHNLFHFLALRMELAAQQEIVHYATIIGEQIVRPLFPFAWEAFVDYSLHAMTLSRIEQDFLSYLTQQQGCTLPITHGLFDAACEGAGSASTVERTDSRDPWLNGEWSLMNRSREREECRDKLIRLGLLR
ncbi:MAG: FAD-dependent thymidylate synthase [Thermoguttaceae bacterium]|nr:FAD-dependent thymidylate synthase [Thermoguttaceae bacterium]